MREIYGEFHTLVRDMRSIDPEKYFECFRMNKEDFDEILAAVKPIITHPRNNRWDMRGGVRNSAQVCESQYVKARKI